MRPGPGTAKIGNFGEVGTAILDAAQRRSECRAPRTVGSIRYIARGDCGGIMVFAFLVRSPGVGEAGSSGGGGKHC
jgi:hypothetical protein